MVDSVWRGDCVAGQLGDRLPDSALSADPGVQTDPTAVVYKCRKCR